MSSLPISKSYRWVASLYFFQSLPFMVVSLIAALVYQNQGMDNSRSLLLVSLLMLPWAIKPFFAPMLEKFTHKKRLTLFAQAAVAMVFLLLSLGVGQSWFLVFSAIAFASLALFSSLHDIVADGLYIQNLDEAGQKHYIPLRTLFYQLGRLLTKGALLVFAGHMAIHFGFDPWQLFFFSLFVIALMLTVYHYYQLPEKQQEAGAEDRHYLTVFKHLVLDSKLFSSLLFLFFYNIADAQMQKIIPLYLLDQKGLHLDLTQVGDIFGLAGSVALMAGIFIAGYLLSRFSLKNCLKWLTLSLVLGPLMFLLLMDCGSLGVYLAVIVNQVTSGMANAAFMAYLLFLANQTNYPMSAYTLCTAMMALSYVFFGALSGFIEQSLGYDLFFLYILLSSFMVFAMTTWRVKKDV